MQPKHVKEAFRLLNKSIIRVEQPDVHLEEDEEKDKQEEMEVEGIYHGDVEWFIMKMLLNDYEKW